MFTFRVLWVICRYTNWNSTYKIKQGSRVSWLAQTVFAANQISPLTSPSGILATSWLSVTKFELDRHCFSLDINWMPVCAYQLSRLPCLVVNVKFQFGYTTRSKIGSQLLLPFFRGSEKAFNEGAGVSNAALYRRSPNLVTNVWLVKTILAHFTNEHYYYHYITYIYTIFVPFKALGKSIDALSFRQASL